MFYFCKQDFILNFNTRNVINMSMMFLRATNFNQPLNFDTSNVTNMYNMVRYAIRFNQSLNFDTSNVTDMRQMFYNTKNFNQPIYFQSNNNTNYRNIFSSSLLEGQENKYVLKPQQYSKLLLFYMLNQINQELPYLCDDFEEFY